MSEKVVVLRIEREEGYIYFIDKDGDISRKKISKKQVKSQKVVRLGIEKEKGYLYFLDKDGDISRATKMSNGKDNEENDNWDEEDDNISMEDLLGDTDYDNTSYETQTDSDNDIDEKLIKRINEMLYNKLVKNKR